MNVKVLIQVLRLHSFVYISSIFHLFIYIYVLSNSTQRYYCFCMKCITLCICLCSSLSRFSASLIQNIGEFGAKNNFIDHWIANAIQLLVPIKKEIFRVSSFSEQVAGKGNSQGLLDRWSHLFICTSSKWTLSSG